MASQEYVVALRRETREQAPLNWVQRIGEIEGVSVVGSTDRRAQVTADENGLAKLQQDFGSQMLIEPMIPHRTQGETEPGPS